MNLKLKKGWLVDSWEGEVSEVFFTKVNYLKFTESEEYYIAFKDNVLLAPISKYSDAKIFEKEHEAIVFSKEVRDKHIKYLERTIKEYQESLAKVKKQ